MGVEIALFACFAGLLYLKKKPQAELKEYFLKDKGGGVFEAYEHDEWCWVHKRSKVWQDALDLTQSSGTGEVKCLFHSPSKKAVEVFASLVTEGPKANAWWGQGVYTVRKAPHEWADVAVLIDNNYRNMHARDTASDGREAADQEYRSRVAYCIPILVNAPMTCDVSIQQAPEMIEKDKPPGVNLAGKLLNEPGLPERQCIVIRVQREEEVGNASAVLLDTLRRRADATEERLGPEDHFALQALSRLAEVLGARGAFAEAEPLRRRDLEARERILGPGHCSTLIALNNLASVLRQLGKLPEAEALYCRCLATREVTLGAQHPHTLSSMSNFAVLLEEQGKLEQAEELKRKSLAGHEALLGAQHPHTLSSVNCLAVLLDKRGKLDEAERLHRRALEGGESQLGSQHPDTLVWVNNVASLLQKQGKLEEAEPLFRRSLAGREAQLGANHPGTLTAVNNLAFLMQKQGKLDEAEQLYRRSLNAKESQLGSGHPSTLISVFNLADLLEAKGSFMEAGQLYVRNLQGLEELHGPNHPETQESRRDLERFQRAWPS